MIAISVEHLRTLEQAARKRPPGRNNRPTHVSTVYRWISKGVRGVKLEAIRIGGRLYTSDEALQRFAERLTQDPSGQINTVTHQTASKCSRASEDAARIFG